MPPRHLVLDLTAALPSQLDSATLLGASVGQVPQARRTASRSAVTTPSSFFSHKMAAYFEADSPGEADAMLLADVLEEVAAFGPQPVEIWYFDGERNRRAFPDLGVVRLDGGVQLWEVKGRTRSRELARRLGHLSASLRRIGVAYRVLTSASLGHSRRQANARELYRHANRPLPSSTAPELRRALSAHGPMDLGTLKSELGLTGADLAAAAARGMVAVDIGGMALGDRTAVRPPLAGARSGGFVGRGG